MDTSTTTEHPQQEDERLAGDLLVGADAILKYLKFLGALPSAPKPATSITSGAPGASPGALAPSAGP